MTTTTRVAAGIPEGGQFSAHVRDDADIELVGDDAPMPRSPELNIRESKLASAEHRIELANRRLARAGIDERFTYGVEHYVKTSDAEPTGVKMVRLTLNRPSLSFEGWKFAGAHEATADGRILNYGTAVTDEMRCDHCGHNRMRGKVYTVTNEETGETKVVGSNCMTAFLGIRPAGLWALEYDLDLSGEEDDEHYGFGSRGADDVFPARGLLLAALAVSDDGKLFIPKSKATVKEPSTAQRVIDQADALLGAEHPAERQKLADDILAWIAEQPDDGDYISNLRTILAGEDRWVSQKHVGFAASAISAYQRARAEKVEREQEVIVPGYVGEIGERMKNIEMEVIRAVRMEDSYFGYHPQPRTLVMLRTPEGKRVKWFGNGVHTYLEPGQKVSVTATVTKHEPYEGRDETTVSRARISEIPEGEA